MKSILLSFLMLGLCANSAFSAAPASGAILERGFENPPGESRLSCFWWWLNGNVTKQSITHDIEEMKAKGFGSAMIFDGNGASQDGNIPVPAGPMYGSKEWIELFKHAVSEAKRCDFSLSLMAMSGWNLGGPNITSEFAAKQLTFSSITVDKNTIGASGFKLKMPPTKHDYYKDIFVLAFPAKSSAMETGKVPLKITASTSQENYSVGKVFDGNNDTYWVSGGNRPETGPKETKPQFINIDFEKPVAVNKLNIMPRSGYGPKKCELFADGKSVAKMEKMNASEKTQESFQKVTAKNFQLKITDAYDPANQNSPRNVQIVSIELYNDDLKMTPGVSVEKSKPLSHFGARIATHEFGWAAPDCTPLYADEPEDVNDPDFFIKDVVDLTKQFNERTGECNLSKLDKNKAWIVLRVGVTLTGATTSTSSGKFQGLVLDHLRKEAFDFYWNDTLVPILNSVKNDCGKTLRYLETDSWEAGGMNWTETFRDEFKKRRGYDLRDYLPIVAGFIGNTRKESNKFLNDFRRTVGDLIADNHYRRFKEKAREYNLGCMPESGGPHAAPIDQLQLLGISDIPMSEFWSWSPRHRVGDAARFFLKQPASAAHTNGHRLVAAEGETNIGMYWQEHLADNLKPSFDQAVCEGLNYLVWHTVTASPKEQGLPGQFYFAGTYMNPQCIVWEKMAPFFNYVNRVDYMMQQGVPFADVLYFYGSGVPNFTQGEFANVAKCLPEYDYDACSEDVLFDQISAIKDGKIILKDGVSYSALVLPPETMISEKAKARIQELKNSGAIVVENKNDTVAVLKQQNIKPDFRRVGTTNAKSRIEWAHRRIYNNQASKLTLRGTSDFSPLEVTTIPADINSGIYAEIYFVANLSKEDLNEKIAFRASGKCELWDAVSGAISSGNVSQTGEVSLQLPPYGSIFVIFRENSSVAEAKIMTPVSSLELTNWEVEFKSPFADEKPFALKFEKLSDWAKSENGAVRNFSGIAKYKKEVNLDEVSVDSRVYLQLENVREIAEVKINGKSAGSIWTFPYKLDITDAVLSARKVNKMAPIRLEIEVANRWVNRLVGDASIPVINRKTKTNITHINGKTPLMPSGIIGDVKILVEK